MEKLIWDIKCSFGAHSYVTVLRHDANPDRRYYPFCQNCRKIIGLPLLEKGLKEKEFIRHDFLDGL